MKIFKVLLLLTLMFNISFAKEDVKSFTFNLKDIKGNSYHITAHKNKIVIDELKGKVVFLAFFGHRCPPCLMEIPNLIAFTKNKKYTDKAVILAFEVQGLPTQGSLNDFKENWQDSFFSLEKMYENLLIKYKNTPEYFVYKNAKSLFDKQKNIVNSLYKNTDINYKLILGSESYDFISYIGQITRWNNAIPYMVTLDTSGKIIDSGNGIVSEEELESYTEKLTSSDNNTTQQGGKHE